MRVLATAFSILLADCSADEAVSSTDAAAPPTSPKPQTLKGYYVSGFERSEFRPEDDLEQRWWLSGAIKDCPFLDFNQERYSPWRQTYLEIQGVLSPLGQYGHLGAYKRKLTIIKTLSCRPPRDGEGVEP